MDKNYSKKIQVEADIVKALRTVFDPEIPVNIYELGLIYEIKVDENYDVEVVMTLTAPNCPVADELPLEVENKIKEIKNVKEAKVTLVFDPPWDMSMLSEEAKLELGML